MIASIIGMTLFSTLPASQRWLAGKVSDVMSKELATEVNIGRVELGLFNRIVVDDLRLMDRSADTLLTATRMSVKFSWEGLFDGQVNLHAVQLFGFDIRLRRPSPDEPYNFQFLVDYFASDDTTSKPLNLQLSEVVIRRGNLSHDVLSAPVSDHFSPSHFKLEDLRIRLSGCQLSETNTQFKINELSLKESRSHLSLDNLTMHLEAEGLKADTMTIRLSEFRLKMPASELNLPTLTASLQQKAEADSSSIALQALEGELLGHISPCDLSPLLPLLQGFRDDFQIYSKVSFDQGLWRLKRLQVDSDDLHFNASASAEHPTTAEQLRATVDLNRLRIEAPLVERVCTLLADSGKLEPALAADLSRLGNIELKGNGTYTSSLAVAESELQTDAGRANVRATLSNGDAYQVHLETADVLLSRILSEGSPVPLDRLTLVGDLSGSLQATDIQGTIRSEQFIWNSEEIGRMEAEFNFAPKDLQASVQLADDRYNLNFDAHLTSNLPFLSGADVVESIAGKVRVSDLTFHKDDQTYRLKDLQFDVEPEGEKGHHLVLNGDFIDAEVHGQFSYLTLASSIQALLHQALPSLVPRPNELPRNHDAFQLNLHLWNSSELFAYAGIDLQLEESAYVDLAFDGATKQLSLQTDFPHIIYSGQEVRDLHLNGHQTADTLTLFLEGSRMMEEGPLDITLNACGNADQVISTLEWNDHLSPVQKGKLTSTTLFSRDEQHHLNTDISLHPTDIIVADTVWSVHPAQILLRKDGVEVRHFLISQLGRHLKVDGSISSSTSDTLYADLSQIDLQYVFGIIDFHDVEFEGKATGKVKVTNFSAIPEVNAQLEVPEFKLNRGLLGYLYLNGGFGRKDDRAIDLDGIIREPLQGKMSHVTALIKPGREPGRGMELKAFANNLNTYFINEFTEGIFDNLQGRASGYAHLYGPFGELDLEGALQLDTISLGVPVLGTRYHLTDKDSVYMSPGSITFKDIHFYDQLHGTDNRRHEAVLNGELRFQHFSNMHYDFDIQAYDLLGYDFRDFGNNSFYGTAIADGTVSLHGQPGRLDVNLNGTPKAGTVFTYNVSTPETLTDNEFINFIDKEAEMAKDTTKSTVSRLPEEDMEEEDDEPNDMHINFDLNITPIAQMRLLMDPKTEDYISLWGNGHIRANFFNKGRFQMFGTFAVDHGNYRLTLQDFIRKEFAFEQGGRITFSGPPMQGDLNLKAIYTVPGVSLNDLAIGSNFSASSVRVNCLMNISGRAENPQISFDFDIPNVNEDEKQMVRSLISTEEERNLQVIYLLGLGRFYTYGTDDNTRLTNSAMNGLLSSTLSGQLNNILSNAIGSKQWNFGTNLNTGQLGWQDMDVEGSLSGRLLNNRLLINGTFGYRNTPVANTNFIGDFDVRWLVNKSGTFSLKAYSETNDRYFTKSALTTQGIGILLKKDFNNLRELFRRGQ